MDKPKINVRAWMPLEKRKKRESYKLKDHQGNPSLSNKQEQVEEKESINPFHSGPSSQEKERKQPIKEQQTNKGPWQEQKKYWNQTDYGPIYVAEERKPKHKKRKKTLSILSEWVHSILAGVGAIITGVFIGYMMLHYFVPFIFQQQPTGSIPMQTNENTLPPIVVEQQTRVISAQAFYLLQAGVFSDYHGAQTTMSMQKNDGRAAIIAGEGPYHVFVGLSFTKENAEMLKEILASQGMEIYIKAYTIPTFTEEMSKKTFDLFFKWLDTGNKMAQVLSKQSIQALDNANTEIDYEQLQQLHQQFLLDKQTLLKALAEKELTTKQKTVQKMAEQMEYAMMALNAYKKNPNPLYLWNIQDLLLNYEMDLEALAKK